MKVWALILVLVWPGLAQAEQQYYGTRVTSLTLEGAPTQAGIEVVPLHVGDTITPENVRASIQALHDTGKYAYIEVDAAAADNGTALTFRVRPHYFFSTIRLSPDDLLERSLSGYVRLPIGEKFSKSAMDRIIEETLELLKAQGYFEAKISPQIDLDESTRLAVITLVAESGVRSKIGTVQVTGGADTYPADDLLDEFGVEKDDDFFAPDIDDGIADIRKKFLDLGFLNTRVTLDQKYASATKTVDLSINVEPGQFTLVETRGYSVSKNKLRELLPIFEEGTVDSDLIEEGRVELEEYMHLQGYFEATVDKEYIEAPLDNAIQINYTIAPGEKHRIRSIGIEGNQYFSEEEIRRRLQIRTAGWFDNGVFSPEILNEDKRTIELMYRNAGFVGTVVDAKFAETNHDVDITIRIEEGTQLPVEFVVFLGNFEIPEKELREAINLKEGDTYTLADLNQARNALTGFYYSRGYPDVRVESNAERIQSNHGMRVTFAISEGKSYKIGSVLVAGNDLTQDKIIYRYANIYPNTPYNPEAILEGQQRLYSTGLFSRVEIVTLQQDLPGTRDLLIQVEDASPILLTYGFGAQEFEGPRVTIEISHNNLFGLDRAISLRTRYSKREQRLQSTYREPRLFNRNLDGFASLFIERAERPAFKASRFDFALQVLKRFSSGRNVLFSSSYQTVNLQDIRVNPRAEEFKEERGVIQIARVGGSYVRDLRDDAVNPSAGTFQTTSLQVANRALGSEINFTSLFNQWSHYSLIGPGVLAKSVRFGWAQPYGGTDRIVITERFFAGGSTTLRGFDLDEALPNGGNIMTIGNLEYRVPLRRFPISGIGGAVFYDTGNVFPKASDIKLQDFTHTAGFGLRYQTPLGPVRLDFGFNLRPKRRPDGSRDELVQVFFTLGHAF